MDAWKPNPDEPLVVLVLVAVMCLDTCAAHALQLHTLVAMGFWLSHIFTYSILQNTVTCEMSEMSNTMQTAPVCKRNPARKEVKLRRRRISITTRCPAVFCLLILAPVNIELNTDLYIKLFDGKKISKRMENIGWCHHAESCIMMHHDASCIFVGDRFLDWHFQERPKTLKLIWIHLDSLVLLQVQ